MTHQEYALIVAGGKGTRFGGTTPKQFLRLKGKPVLLHAVEAFYHYSHTIRIVLVLPEEHIPAWQDIAAENQFRKSVVVKSGGATRFQSVKNGLQEIPDDAYVAIHDGVRPLVSAKIISTSFQMAKIHQSAVAAVSLKESLRLIRSDGDSETQSVDRSRYRLIQTPQTFHAALIRKAYLIEEDASLTDDASVAERAGFQIHLFDGHYSNIKITTQEDLVVAEAIMDSRSGL